MLWQIATTVAACHANMAGVVATLFTMTPSMVIRTRKNRFLFPWCLVAVALSSTRSFPTASSFAVVEAFHHRHHHHHRFLCPSRRMYGRHRQFATAATSQNQDSNNVNNNKKDSLPQPIVSFQLDEFGDWKALLACGHCQHVRHNPPMVERPWVLTKEGRQKFMGHKLNCKLCVSDATPKAAATASSGDNKTRWFHKAFFPDDWGSYVLSGDFSGFLASILRQPQHHTGNGDATSAYPAFQTQTPCPHSIHGKMEESFLFCGDFDIVHFNY